MAGPVEGTFQAAVVDVAPATASPEAVLGRGVSDLQGPAMVTATSSRTRPGSRRAGVIVGDLRSLNALGEAGEPPEYLGEAGEPPERLPDLTDGWFRSNVHRNKAPLRFAVRYLNGGL